MFQPEKSAPMTLFFVLAMQPNKTCLFVCRSKRNREFLKFEAFRLNLKDFRWASFNPSHSEVIFLSVV